MTVYNILKKNYISNKQSGCTVELFTSHICMLSYFNFLHPIINAVVTHTICMIINKRVITAMMMIQMFEFVSDKSAGVASFVVAVVVLAEGVTMVFSKSYSSPIQVYIRKCQ